MGDNSKKILLTTTYIQNNNYYDYWAANFPTRIFRYTIQRRTSFGLRFLKQNVPEIEILEYPSWEEYLKKLKDGWDVVGFSFYMNETHEILEMIEAARRAGAKEIWGGNYGVLTTDIQPKFDRVFIGYSEYVVGKEVGREVKEIIHPPIVWYYGTTLGINLNTIGFLFTSRGCNVGCNFCQTPVFCQKVEKIPIESVERVLRYYKSIGVNIIDILDENFGMFRTHTEKVVGLLGKYGLYWFPMMRADMIPEDMDHWIENGYLGAQIGIETLNPDTMEDIGKRITVEKIKEVISHLKESNRIIEGYYVIGFENETVQSIKEDMKRLAALQLDLYQLCVLTPLPSTPCWKEIDEKYGIFEKDYHKYNAKHLVWNHPDISPDQMSKLLKWCFKEVYPKGSMVHHAYDMFRSFQSTKGGFGTTKQFLKSFMISNLSSTDKMDVFFDIES